MIAHTNRGRVTVDIDGNWRLYTPLAPEFGKILGTVSRGDGDTGALAVNTKTGIYTQINAGTHRSLPQSKVKAALDAVRAGKRGGAGMGQGRTAEDGATNLERKQVQLNPKTIDTLTALGDGNLSLGIRKSAHIVKSR